MQRGTIERRYIRAGIDLLISQFCSFSDGDYTYKCLCFALYNFSLKDKPALLLPDVDLKTFSREDMTGESNLYGLQFLRIISQ